MIPLLLLGGGLLAINEMDKAERKTREASQINEEAAKLSETAYNRVKNSQQNMMTTLDNLGKTKEDLLEGSIETFVDILEKIGKKINLDHDTKGLRELEEGGITEAALKELRKLSDKSHEITDVTANQKINLDNNHDWAVLGAMGTAAAGFGVIAAPVLLLYSFMESDKAEAALYKAKTQLDKARLYDEQCKNTEALFGAITTRAKQIDNLLDDLNYGYFNAAISQVQNVYNENKNKTFSAYPPEAKVSVFYAFQLVETLKIIINTSMLNEDLTLNIDIEGPLEIGQQVYDLLPPSHNIDSKKMLSMSKEKALTVQFPQKKPKIWFNKGVTVIMTTKPPLTIGKEPQKPVIRKQCFFWVALIKTVTTAYMKMIMKLLSGIKDRQYAEMTGSMHDLCLKLECTTQTSHIENTNGSLKTVYLKR